MRPLRLTLLSVCCLTRAFSAIPLAFEQHDRSLFIAHTGPLAIRFQPDRLIIGDITLRFEGAQPQARLEGIGPASPATYIGATSRRSFPQYPRLALHDLYPGIDAVFYANAGQLEYDLTLAANAQPHRILVHFDNARSLHIAADGALVVETAAGELRQLPPRVFQSHQLIPAHYVLTAGRGAAIRLGRYNHRLPLTVDPVLIYSKYFGGSNSDQASAVATDGQGNAYIAGHSNSLDFPSAGGSTRPLPPLVALTNAGQTIANLPIGNGAGVTAIGGTPDGSILYAGSGATVYYSSNAGASWKPTAALPAEIPGPLTTSTLTVTDITVDAIDPSRAYVATNRGIFATSDNGQSWSPRDYDLAANFDSSISASSIVVSQADHTILYAATSQPNFIYRSADAGATWKILNPAYPGEAPPTPFTGNQLVFALAPAGADLYVVDLNAFLLKSSDGGATWQQLAGSLYGARSIRLDAANPSNVFIWDSAGIQKSADGGSSFTAINPPGATQGAVTGLAYEPASHTIYGAVNGSIFASTDQGATWKAAPLDLLYSIHTMQAIGGRLLIGIDTPPAAFLVKFDPTGSQVLYSTFFTGKPFDNFAGLKVDTQGNAYLLGTTQSQNLAGAKFLTPQSPGPTYNGYLAKIAPDGTSVVYFSVFGGSKGVFPSALAVDSTGAVYLTGETSSPDFPTTPGAAQSGFPTGTCTRPGDPFAILPGDLGIHAFAAKVSPDGSSFLYATFVSGVCGSAGETIAIDAAGEAFLGGFTTSPSMPVSPNAYQSAFPGPVDKTPYPNAYTAGFAAKLSADGGKILGGTYVGGGYNSSVLGIAVDSAGNPILAGATWGIANGATPGAFQSFLHYSCAEAISMGPARAPVQGTDAFLLKLDAAFSKPAYMTYLGGSCADAAVSVALDPSGNTWVSGNTASADFPTVGAFQVGGGSFISELSPDGSKLLFSSYAEGSAMSIDPLGAVYLAGATQSPVIPKNSPVDTTAWLAKIGTQAAPAVEIDSIASLSLPGAPATPYVSAGVAPGELIRIDGHNLGPSALVNAQLDASNRLPFSLAGTRILFDGNPAPLISVQDTSVVCFVPFAVTRTTQVTAEVNNQDSNIVRVNVSAAEPEILAVVNQDGTANSPANPAPQGSVVAVYVTGLGITRPASMDGQVTTAPPPVPIAQVIAIVGFNAVTPQYVAAAVGLVAGISQVNVPIRSGDYPNGQTTISINFSAAPLYVGPASQPVPASQAANHF